MTLRPPLYSLTVGSEDLTDLVNMDSLSRLMTERGEASCTFTIPVAGENEAASNALVRDAVVLVQVDGEVRWYGHVVNVTRPDPESVYVECAGEWDKLHQREDYCKGFVETRYEGIVEMPPEKYPAISGTTFKNDFDVNTDGQVNFVLPKGTRVKVAQGKIAYLWPFNGLDASARVSRVTASWTCGGANQIQTSVQAFNGTPFANTTASPLSTVMSAVGESGSFDSNDLGLLTGNWATFLAFFCAAAADVAETAAENFTQLRSLVVYYNRTTAPRIDQAAAEIWTDVTGSANTATEAIGSALTHLMIDPFVTGADAITQVLAKATVPPLCGVIHNQFKCINRPTSPPDKSRLWVVSDALTPDLEWDVTPDMAQSKDYVAFTYTQHIPSPTTIPSGLPARVYYPSTPPSKTSRVALIESGTEMTDAEAAAFAQQAYHYYHEPPAGQVVIPSLCLNGYGQECYPDHIECWDWVYNAGKADPAEAGPFLISEVSHEGGVATLTIGASEGYSYESPYRLPTASKYVGAAAASKGRKRVKQWRRSKTRPKGKGWRRAKGNRWWRWRVRK